MEEAPAPHTPAPPGPASFLAAAAALQAIDQAIDTAHRPSGDGSSPSTEQALAALLLLRELRRRLDGWESGLIETARDAGASWADLAAPLGVASRQAAERRYLRLKPTARTGDTQDQRVKAERDRRAADRAVTVWARSQAADLRRLAGQITALTDLPETALPHLSSLTAALGEDDAALLLEPLIHAAPYLTPRHPELAARAEALAADAHRLRRDSTRQRRTLS